MKYRINPWRFAFWIAVISILYLGIKSTPNTQLFSGADKFYHWLAFTVLTVTAHYAYPRLPLPLLCLTIIAGSAGIELLQTLSPDRTTSLADLTVNIVGVLSGLAITQLLSGDQDHPRGHTKPSRRKKRHKRRRHSHTERHVHSADDAHEPSEGHESAPALVVRPH
ncbi:hypothetical protein JQR85_11390 [Stutzerimonas urumqiensis]|uniref:VanZ family protein n=1 Tax=Stutzerimonas urumqiensis TaxID=638269 RepID=UPI003DA6B9C3